MKIASRPCGKHPCQSTFSGPQELEPLGPKRSHEPDKDKFDSLSNVLKIRPWGRHHCCCHTCWQGRQRKPAQCVRRKTTCGQQVEGGLLKFGCSSEDWNHAFAATLDSLRQKSPSLMAGILCKGLMARYSGWSINVINRLERWTV